MAKSVLTIFTILFFQWTSAHVISFNDAEGYGWTFDGIGGLSGGGVSSLIKLLYNLLVSL